ncbi:amino acid--tRNA ligase-related protein [Streptomyces sp. NBC_01716]|uniref:amino acid--tRNA ligase-related protein n=1 Tax=Streptomyces sp. NBC_01716 TaxID=2975917 RepID=UPI002E31DF92|nr:amino acid--tRNA ligase-related protein [Streptomyces sp. NBC_01716]
MTQQPRFDHGGWRPDADRFIRILDDPFYRLLIGLQDLATRVTTRFWTERGSKCMHLPITTDSVSSPMGLGSDSVPVSVEMFDRKTYLADSMQFMLEYGCRFNEDGVWYLMPSFRGEDADATHLNQFFHSEAEISGGLDDVMRTSEEYLRELARAVLTEYADELALVAGSVRHVEKMATSDAFERMTFSEAAARLSDDADAVRTLGEGIRTLTRHGELRLLKEVGPFVWVTHYDHLSVPFYQAYEDDSMRSARNADLLFGPGEIVGCGERHTDGKALVGALNHHDVPVESYDWYVRMKTEAPLLTSGFGMGMERWLMWLLDQYDIRELQLVPRLNGVSLRP